MKESSQFSQGWGGVRGGNGKGKREDLEGTMRETRKKGRALLILQNLWQEDVLAGERKDGSHTFCILKLRGEKKNSCSSDAGHLSSEWFFATRIQPIGTQGAKGGGGVSSRPEGVLTKTGVAGNPYGRH